MQNCDRHSTVTMDYSTIPLHDWTEEQVSHWLQSLPINKKYIDKLMEEEVYGQVLKEIDETFLSKNIGMKQGPIKLLIKRREELLLKHSEQDKPKSSDSKVHPDYSTIPLNDWTEDHTVQWLQSISINKKYIDKLTEEEVYGPELKVIDEEFLSSNGMRQGPIYLLLKRRDELIVQHNGVPTNQTEEHKDVTDESTSKSKNATSNAIGKNKDTSIDSIEKSKSTANPTGKSKNATVNENEKSKDTIVNLNGRTKDTAANPTGKTKDSTANVLGKPKDATVNPDGKTKDNASVSAEKSKDPNGSTKDAASVSTKKSKDTAANPTGKIKDATVNTNGKTKGNASVSSEKTKDARVNPNGSTKDAASVSTEKSKDTAGNPTGKIKDATVNPNGKTKDNASDSSEKTKNTTATPTGKINDATANLIRKPKDTTANQTEKAKNASANMNEKPTKAMANQTGEHKNTRDNLTEKPNNSTVYLNVIQNEKPKSAKDSADDYTEKSMDITSNLNVKLKETPADSSVKRENTSAVSTRKHLDTMADLDEKQKDTIEDLDVKQKDTIADLNGKRAQDSSDHNVPENNPCALDKKASGYSEPPEIKSDTINTETLKSSKSLVKESSAIECKSEKSIKSDPISVSNFRPFHKEVGEFKYIKNKVLPPESGVEDLITPCHEYKSLDTAAKLDRVRLQAKFAHEVIRFACACMNVRTNGTIHFGVMDSVGGKGYKHGQIIGIPVDDQDWYVDALDYIERCFNKSDHNAARTCIRNPKFVEVIDKNSDEQSFVVEVDIVPDWSSVRGKVFQVSLPKFNEKSNKVIQEKKAYYRRVGAKSEIVLEDDNVQFIQGLQDVDARREAAESRSTCEVSAPENLTQKIDLLTGGKEYMDDTQWYILVTNRCESHHLTNLHFLMRLKIFCVFDFDAQSDETGLCSIYKEHHARNIHSVNDYANESKMSISELRKHLGLFDQTSWIFCNGNSNYRGEDKSCDENTWIKTKKKYLIKSVSLICEEIFPKGSYTVVFLLSSPVEKPILDTFECFYTHMGGMEDIICISENKDYYEKWASLAQTFCDMEILEKRSIVGLQLSHINATIQSKFPAGNPIRSLPVSSKGGICVLETPSEEKMHSLDILCVNQCNETNVDLLSKEEIKELEGTFYRGGKIGWKHLWLAEQKKCGYFIERDACKKVQNILDGILHENTVRLPVARIKIFHHPGSGGSTVARQVMWKNRNILRCAIVKSSHPFSTVSQHAVKLREYDEDNPNLCLPVLLLVEDCEEDYLDDLRHDLAEAMVYKKITYSKPCFILMSCKRSNAPEDLFKSSPSDTVIITHKLSEREKMKFTTKAKELEKEFPCSELILTFVLMSHEFDEQYVKDFVQNVMKGIDQSSIVTRLMRYVALLNYYVQNSYISVSHCEAFLGLGVSQKLQHNAIQQHNFKSCLSEQARLLFIELREENTWISSIQIIHPLIAKEVLNQLTGQHTQGKIANDLLEEKVLLQHRFGRDEFLKFIRDLFLRRNRKSRGDSVDTFFSPLIEHVCKVENDKEKAVIILKAAYERFDKDPFLAQQLARLCYTHERFDEATKWVETAKLHLPGNSFILDTEGQVYKKQFNMILDRKKNSTPAEVVSLIDIGLKSMECFRAAEKAAESEFDTMNNSSYNGEVDVGCRLLQMLSTLPIFTNNSSNENSELLMYLTTDYIPEDLKKPWLRLHGRLKGLYQNIYNALEWIADDVGYFQSEKIEEGEQPTRAEEHIYSPRTWLLRKTKVFANFFSSKLSDITNDGHESQLVRKMNIYKLGGGSTATIISILANSNDGQSAKKLENIIDLYPADVFRDGLDDVGLENYIMSHIALGCVCPGSSKLLSFQKLCELSKRFQNTRRTFSPSAYFIIFLLYWPDDKVDDKPDPNKDVILTNALQTARALHARRIKDIPVRKKRTNVLFFLGKGYGLQKILQRSKIEKQIAGPLNERRMKWDNDALWKTDSVHRLLRNVPGWTENGKLYARGHCKKNKIEILAMNASSVPFGNENVTFNLGFTFIGYVGYNIQVQTG